MSAIRTRAALVGFLLLGAWLASWPAAAQHFFAYNQTTRTDFKGVYLAPAGTGNWGPNQALNDKDKALDASERLTLTGLKRGKFDVKLVDDKGRICILKGIDLTNERSFEIHDKDLAAC